VICGGVYTIERDSAGRERLVAITTGTPSVETGPGTTNQDADAKALVGGHWSITAEPRHNNSRSAIYTGSFFATVIFDTLQRVAR